MVYLILVIIMQFILWKLLYPKLVDKMENCRRNYPKWLEFAEGWGLVFGGILFPFTLLIILLHFIWNKLDLDSKFNPHLDNED